MFIGTKDCGSICFSEPWSPNFALAVPQKLQGYIADKSKLPHKADFPQLVQGAECHFTDAQLVYCYMADDDKWQNYSDGSDTV